MEIENLEETDLDFEKEISLAIANQKSWNSVESIVDFFTRKLFTKTQILTKVLLKELRKYEKEVHEEINSDNVEQNQEQNFQIDNTEITIEENTTTDIDNIDLNEIDNSEYGMNESVHDFEEGEVYIPSTITYKCKNCEKTFFTDKALKEHELKFILLCN